MGKLFKWGLIFFGLIVLVGVVATSGEKPDRQTRKKKPSTKEPARTPAPAPASKPAPHKVSGVICDKFDVAAELKGDTVEINLDTDLPGDTVVMVSVDRSYWIKGSNDAYSESYFSEKSTVGKWKATRTIAIDDKQWTAKLNDKRRMLAKIGESYEPVRFDEQITVSFVVPVNQPNAAFGKLNAELRGKAVTKSDSLRIVKSEKSFHRPRNGAVSKPLQPSVTPDGLKVGKGYVLSKKTALMPHFEAPTDISDWRIVYLPPGTTVEVLAIRSKRGTNWYQVNTQVPGTAAKTGWINSIALIGQDITEASGN